MMTDTEFDIVTIEDTHTYLQIVNEKAGINLLVEVYREDIENIRDVLPDQPPNYDKDEDEDNDDDR